MGRSIVATTFEDDRQRARQRLPRQLFEFIDGGSFGEETLAANRNDFARVHLRQRVLMDVGNAVLDTEIFGERFALPLGLSPVGLAGLMRRRGEAQAVRAATAAGVPFVLSTVSLCGIEEVAAAAARPFWFQLYFLRDRDYVAKMIGRAQQAGCTALVMTVDVPVNSPRHRDAQTGMGGVPSALARAKVVADFSRRWPWLRDVAVGGRPHIFGNLAAAIPDARGLADFRSFTRANWDNAIGWKDVAWVRDQWDGPLVIKGILDPQDAAAAVAAGANGIVVSNHGGRQLDGVASSISMLPAIANAVGGRAEIFLDGGVRNAIDVLRARALGAKACFVGRPWVLALAADGEAGVARMIERFRIEMISALGLMGLNDVADVGAEALAHVPPEWSRGEAAAAPPPARRVATIAGE
ncbi:L-lactate dehydrogenase [Chelatococcus reniformis]|uniref:L-lactate dehydrogenase n=1 Tax=Chelatococcus reniformis TaxID=1494448 RepID=A0A916UAA0_9HYPH|nr:L-lactate dehydrogenase [Chelatococcus reniformis]GGC65639.1 L-lactate dehydrogenase [Chelatococcus reniformis]